MFVIKKESVINNKENSNCTGINELLTLKSCPELYFAIYI